MAADPDDGDHDGERDEHDGCERMTLTTPVIDPSNVRSDQCLADI
jgi:hypothetical protein